MEAVIPNPKQMPYFLKNEPVNIYFMLKPDCKELEVKIKFTNPISLLVEEYMSKIQTTS